MSNNFIKDFLESTDQTRHELMSDFRTLKGALAHYRCYTNAKEKFPMVAATVAVVPVTTHAKEPVFFYVGVSYVMSGGQFCKKVGSYMAVDQALQGVTKIYVPEDYNPRASWSPNDLKAHLALHFVHEQMLPDYLI